MVKDCVSHLTLPFVSNLWTESNDWQKRNIFNLHGHVKEEDLVDSLRKFALQNLIEENQYYTE